MVISHLAFLLTLLSPHLSGMLISLPELSDLKGTFAGHGDCDLPLDIPVQGTTHPWLVQVSSLRSTLQWLNDGS